VAESSDFTIFREVPDLPWANLMLGATSLPRLPPERLQRDWCGNSGAELVMPSAEFYRLLKDSYARLAGKPLGASKILDFGCGWGRITRLFSKDLPPSLVFGCDSDPKILEWCSEVPGTFRQSETKLRRLPFDETFDLAFAFSVFTHLGPNTHRSALEALHASLDANGLLIVTIRPRAFIEVRGSELGRLPDETIDLLLRNYDSGEFVYYPYNMPTVEGEVPYGEAVIPQGYIDRNWTDRFEILEQLSYPSDPYQLPLVMRKA
jgi:SAM-dependent methyltransferase